MHPFLQPSSLHSGVPPNDVCSSIPDSPLVLNEEQPTEGVSVSQLTCFVIHEEYEWELEHQNSAKDDSLMSESPLLFPNLFGEPTSMILHVYLHPRMHPLLITRKTHRR